MHYKPRASEYSLAWLVLCIVATVVSHLRRPNASILGDVISHAFSLGLIFLYLNTAVKTLFVYASSPEKLDTFSWRLLVLWLVIGVARYTFIGGGPVAFWLVPMSFVILFIVWIASKMRSAGISKSSAFWSLFAGAGFMLFSKWQSVTSWKSAGDMDFSQDLSNFFLVILTPACSYGESRDLLVRILYYPGNSTLVVFGLCAFLYCWFTVSYVYKPSDAS